VRLRQALPDRFTAGPEDQDHERFDALGPVM
jgi:hypothetical protein